MANMPSFGEIGRALSGKAARMNPEVKEVCFYLLKAVALASFLTIVGKFATAWPAPVFPFVLLIYALVATMGALYYVVVRRIHRQDMFAEGGTLSRYNRKWTAWLICLFVFSLCSALAFVLGAPRWDGLEWVLIWVAIPLYYLLFKAADRRAKKEYREPYHRAKAMKWSCAIALVALCSAYAALSVHDSMTSQVSALDALRNPYMPFESSPSALLAEADKLSALVNNLTNYGFDQIAAGSFAAAFVVRFALSFSVFLGVVTQFGFCMLSVQEMKSEWQLLPAREDGRHASQPFQWWYLVAVVAISALASGAFIVADNYASKMRASNEYTAVDAFVTKHTEEIIFVLEGGLEEHLEDRAIDEEYKRELDEKFQARKEMIDPLINAYYDACIANVDSYIDWREGIVGGFAGNIGSLGNGMLVDNFKKKVADPVDSMRLEREYEMYIDELIQLNSAYWIARNNGGSDAPLPVRVLRNELEKSKEPALWRLLDEESISDETRDVLKNVGKKDRQAYKEELIGLIEQARSDVFDELDKAETTCANATSIEDWIR